MFASPGSPAVLGKGSRGVHPPGQPRGWGCVTLPGDPAAPARVGDSRDKLPGLRSPSAGAHSGHRETLAWTGTPVPLGQGVKQRDEQQSPLPSSSSQALRGPSCVLCRATNGQQGSIKGKKLILVSRQHVSSFCPKTAMGCLWVLLGPRQSSVLSQAQLRHILHL